MSGPITRAIYSVIRRFDWDTIFLVADTAGNSAQMAAFGLYELAGYLRKNGVTLFTETVDTAVRRSPFGEILAKIRTAARSKLLNTKCLVS